jgi:hypothetical protein
MELVLAGHFLSASGPCERLLRVKPARGRCSRNPSLPVRHLGSSHGLAGRPPSRRRGLMEQAMLDLVAWLEAQPGGLAARQFETANRVAL